MQTMQHAATCGPKCTSTIFWGTASSVAWVNGHARGLPSRGSTRIPSRAWLLPWSFSAWVPRLSWWTSGVSWLYDAVAWNGPATGRIPPGFQREFLLEFFIRQRFGFREFQLLIQLHGFFAEVGLQWLQA